MILIEIIFDVMIVNWFCIVLYNMVIVLGSYDFGFVCVGIKVSDLFDL